MRKALVERIGSFFLLSFAKCHDSASQAFAKLNHGY